MFRLAPARVLTGIAGLITAASVAVPAPALAVTIVGHTPAKLLKQGTTAKPSVKGTVEVQVLVKADGSFKVQKILHSTAPSDDAAALDIAKSSTYQPAVLNGKPDTEFYDFVLKFTAAGAAGANANVPAAGTLASYEAMIKANKLPDAQTGLGTYLTAHPGDAAASLDLAQTDTLIGDPADLATAAALFAKADTIPDTLKPAALKALYETSVADVNAKKNDEALVYAKKAVDVSPSYVMYAQLGSVQVALGDSTDAAAAFEKALSLGSAATPPATSPELATINFNLVPIYLGLDELDKAKASATTVKSLDPTRVTDGFFGKYYADKAAAKEKTMDFAGEAALLEQGAAIDPKDAVTLYGNAAFAYLRMKTPDFAKVKTDADKALAIDPTDAQANFAEGVALANTGHQTDAVAFLKKADAAAKAKGYSALSTSIEANLKAIGGTN